MRAGPKNRRRGVRDQVVDEIKLLEQGPDGAEEMDGGAEVEQNGAVLGIVQPLVVNEAFVASSGSEELGVRAAASQEEPHPPQALSKSTKEPDHGQQVKEATRPAVEQVPPQASVNVPKKKGRRRADQPEEGEQLVKVRAKREGGKAPRSASTGDPRAARRQQEGRDQRSHQRRSSAERTTAHLPAKPTQKGKECRNIHSLNVGSFRTVWRARLGSFQYCTLWNFSCALKFDRPENELLACPSSYQAVSKLPCDWLLYMLKFPWWIVWCRYHPMATSSPTT